MMYVHRNRTGLPVFCTYIGWGVAKSAHWHADGAGSAVNGAGPAVDGAGLAVNGAGPAVDGAGSAVDGADSILEPKPAPPEQRRGPIRGAGSAPFLELAPLTP